MTTVTAKDRISASNPLFFEEAREAAITLRNLRRHLTPAELETLEILLDKQTVSQLSKSLKETKNKKLEPIRSILK